jgi:hypothetical protein
MSLVTDKNGDACLLFAYYSVFHDNRTGLDLSSKIVKMAKETGNGWSVENVSLPPIIDSIGNLAVDSKNVPHFIYTYYNLVSAQDRQLISTLAYASWDGSSWFHGMYTQKLS